MDDGEMGADYVTPPTNEGTTTSTNTKSMNSGDSTPRTAIAIVSTTTSSTPETTNPHKVIVVADEPRTIPTPTPNVTNTYTPPQPPPTHPSNAANTQPLSLYKILGSPHPASNLFKSGHSRPWTPSTTSNSPSEQSPGVSMSTSTSQVPQPPKPILQPPLLPPLVIPGLFVVTSSVTPSPLPAATSQSPPQPPTTRAMKIQRPYTVPELDNASQIPKARLLPPATITTKPNRCHRRGRIELRSPFLIIRRISSMGRGYHI